MKHFLRLVYQSNLDKRVNPVTGTNAIRDFNRNMEKSRPEENTAQNEEIKPTPVATEVKKTDTPYDGAPSGKKKRNNKRKKKSGGHTPADVDVEKEKKPQKKMPNYFLGVQITNPAIIGGMKALQDGIVIHDKRLRQAVVNVKSAHLTLAILYLPDEQSVTRACEILRGIREKLDDILNEESIVLDISSIGNFGGKVLFAKVTPGANAERVSKIADLVDKEFEECKSSNSFDYKPHITLMKLSKAPKLRKKVRCIESSYYEKIENVSLGTQKVESLQLLSMLKKKQPDGYYHCESEASLDPQVTSQAESEQSSSDAQTAASSATNRYAAFVSGYNVISAYCEMVNGKQIDPHGKDEHQSKDGAALNFSTARNKIDFITEENLEKDGAISICGTDELRRHQSSAKSEDHRSPDVDEKDAVEDGEFAASHPGKDD